MFKKILVELVAIRKELQAIRSSLEPRPFVAKDCSGARYSGLSNSIAPSQASHSQDQ